MEMGSNQVYVQATAREQVEEHVEKLGGSVIFENVHFKYPTRETPVLKVRAYFFGGHPI